MALAAFQTDVVWMMMRAVLVLVCVGQAAGLAGAFVLAKLVQTQLYGVTGHDPVMSLWPRSGWRLWPARGLMYLPWAPAVSMPRVPCGTNSFAVHR
jgi:hypothetical protein